MCLQLFCLQCYMTALCVGFRICQQQSQQVICWMVIHSVCDFHSVQMVSAQCDQLNTHGECDLSSDACRESQTQDPPSYGLP